MKEIVGASKKTIDDELRELKNELQTVHKRLKKSYSDFSKLPESGRTATVAHMNAMKSGMEVMADVSCFEESFSVFEELDQKQSLYGVKMKEEVIDPIKKLMELLNTVEKRMKILEDRRLDMDAASGKVESISKKKEEKQHGLQEAEMKFVEAKDNYDYLRNEVVQDTKRALDEVKKQYPQLCVNCLKSYTDYVNELNDIWSKVPEIIKSQEHYEIPMEMPITPQDQSMLNTENVRMMKNKSVSIVAEPYAIAATIPSNESSMSSSKLPPPPPKKNVETKSSSVVVALYDYDATDDGELSFKEGDEIKVIDNSGDW
jgi:endophilin-A